jgi:hypothetical protein
MRIQPGLVVLLAGEAFLSAASSLAEGSAAAAPQFGVDRETVYVVTPWDAQTESSLKQWGTTPDEGFRYLIGGGSLLASVRLPDGALLTSFEVEACDSTAAGRVSVSLSEWELGSLPVTLASYSSGVAETPGCGRATVPITGGTIDNVAKRYLVVFFNTSDDGTTAAGAARISYKLQVSPAPATATFNDVPTSDPAFQFIEALVASGITAGCGGGNYCPDAPLTRRQMAVFLSKALGLQWPPM